MTTPPAHENGTALTSYRTSQKKQGTREQTLTEKEKAHAASRLQRQSRNENSPTLTIQNLKK
jgi:hypothetical protein